MAHFDHFCKIVLVGDNGVGKTALRHRYCRNHFPLPTDEKSTYNKEWGWKERTTEMEDKKKVKAQIWEQSQERYRAITNAFYRGALGALLVYDVTSYTSFDNVSVWLKELRNHANRDIVLILVGNKIDLLENGSKRAVSQDDTKSFAEERNLLWMEASAKSGTNVVESFEKLVRAIYEYTFLNRQPEQTNPEVQLLGPTSNAKTCCN